MTGPTSNEHVLTHGTKVTESAEQSEQTEAMPSWATPGWTDEHGNVKCSSCGAIQSDAYKACPACCPHDVLDFIESYHGTGECGGWVLDVVCSRCGKDYGWDILALIEGYQAVRVRKA